RSPSFCSSSSKPAAALSFSPLSRLVRIRPITGVFVSAISSAFMDSCVFEASGAPAQPARPAVRQSVRQNPAEYRKHLPFFLSNMTFLLFRYLITSAARAASRKPPLLIFRALLHLQQIILSFLHILNDSFYRYAQNPKDKTRRTIL